MKRIAVPIISLFLCQQLAAQENESDRDSFYVLSPVEVKAIRAGDKAPFTKINITKKEIEKVNLGQDIPFILNQTPSVVINSDAGNGVGYTGIHIRGMDASRVNVTLNGIPYNDAESQGTFFVDLPDVSSSIHSIQIQRGVGTSSNGTGAFGATISLSTNEFNSSPYAEINNSYGSFNTWKHTVKTGSGLINDHFTVDARLSQVTSNGYIDRAKSRLQSFYLSGALKLNKSTVRLNIISGKEKTYQAWNGVPENLLKSDRAYNSSGTDKPGEPYNNETDNYWQTHYQLFFNKSWNENWNFNTAAFLTRGLGYYENYKGAQSFIDYGLPNVVIGGSAIEKTDLVRQKWLDNYFYGQIFSAQYKWDKNAITVGAGWSVYDGNHHGNVIWAQYGFDKDYKYYGNDALKSDINIYGKWQYDISKYWSLFTDIQYRHVQHKMQGFENRPGLDINRKFDFINPKAGISFNKNGWQSYFSYALANKEPNRNDFEASQTNQPQKETLHDFETGFEKRTTMYQFGATVYYMHFKNQLVLTGKINDVGAYTRTNIPKSYRAGIELQGMVKPFKWINASANFSLSSNKMMHFTEYIDDYDNGGQKINNYKTTDISFSPSIVGGATISFFPAEHFEISLLGKYVSKQYLDNTQDNGRMLDPFYVQDIRVIYTFHKKWLREVNIIVQLNNLFNNKYEPNGYTYNYFYGGKLSVNNYYFPMAGTNFMIGVNVRL